ncbi:unnamed protein product [Macrosiphum euphorbiae]|uniref:Uncharacterized protein n=1 Tax=Macrosiphum euphorbiae TaxID=13131 RepID=A0AAV0WKZ7_9HEMI|nr:unnamed protein product [Macrosiphum euphorbiae]CAI6356515.1 unnamed protein product [Macrosiphum euphorbiae]
MYPQNLVLEKHRGYQHILWRDSPQHQMAEHTLNNVTYGVNSTSYLQVLRHNIADNDCKSALVRHSNIKHTWMISVMCSVGNML